GVDRRGLVNENDVARLMEFRQARESIFKTNLAKGKITADNVRGKDKVFSADKLLDNNFETYWAADDGVTKASLTLDFGRETEFNQVLLQENIALGQRVKKFSIQIWNGQGFETVAQATTIGYKRIIRFPKVKTDKLKVVIEDSKACPTLSTLEVYKGDF
ncbi:MAG TPA: discoidin domain-containing protein, partial [Pyrinomonadaceae bacterium]|nr:discoidin domain-containing protein [Pyrinomonadaceae bacterium]